MFWSTKSRIGARFAVAVVGVLLASLVTAIPGTAEAGNPKVNVAVGQSVTQKMPTVIKTVSIANTDIADVVVAVNARVTMTATISAPTQRTVSNTMMWMDRTFSFLWDKFLGRETP